MVGGKTDSVIVVGGGVAGIQSALDLAELGVKVSLIEKSSSIGGVLPQLDKQFPTNHCGMCRMLPIFDHQMSSQFCLRRGLRHPNIELVTNAQVESAKGSVGEFVVTVKEDAPRADPSRCTGCGRCAEICPVQVVDRSQGGFSKRKAIYIKHPQVIPNTYIIDTANCTKCGDCIKACPTDAIDLSKELTTRKLKAGAIILSSGFEEFDAQQLRQYGYKRYANVFSNLELERMLSGVPTSLRGIDAHVQGNIPERVAFLQCVGSRDSQRDYCSGACCMYALKEAGMLKELNPDTQVSIFYMDLRAFGKTHHRYYQDMKKMGIRFIRCKVPCVEEMPDTGDLKLTYETERGELAQEVFGMVVLSTGQSPPAEAEALSSIFGVRLNEDGFCATRGVNTSVEGIYACGSFTEPKDIESTIIEAGAAAVRAVQCLPRAKKSSAVQNQETSIFRKDQEEPRMGIFLCSCGGEIGEKVDLTHIAELSGQLPDVHLVEVSDFLCLPDALATIRDKIGQFQLDRVILGACERHLHEEKFKKVVAQSAFDPSLLEIVDLREQLAWVHQDKRKATEKAASLIAMTHKMLHLQSSPPIFEHEIVPRALVIGGGGSGLRAALSIAERGFEVDIVERGSELGGNLKQTFYTLEGLDVPKLLRETLDEVKKSKLIQVYTNAQVKKVEGGAGNFNSTIISGDNKLVDSRYGAIVVATGARQHESQAYLYGQHPRIITQKELEALIAEKPKEVKALNNVVMIQCVDSRDDDRPYCSRVCCTQALKNGLKMKEVSPETNVFVIYRDMMSYGFKEKYYTRAREKGITFLRYDVDARPTVTVNKNDLSVEILDPLLDATLVIKADLVALSPGIAPHSNGELAEVLGVHLDEDGFFQEADIKFRPLDFLKPGIFCCGLARAPQCIEESIVQAHAVAARVAVLLSKGEIRGRKLFPEVIDDICSGCGACVRVCPYDARRIDEETRVAQVSALLCQCCGDCATACPNGATRQVHSTTDQILAMVDAAIEA